MECPERDRNRADAGPLRIPCQPHDAIGDLRSRIRRRDLHRDRGEGAQPESSKHEQRLAPGLRFKLEHQPLDFGTGLSFSTAMLRRTYAANRTGHEIADRQ